MTTIRPLCVAASMAASVIVAILSVPTTAAAQTNDETFQNLQWNFSTPGARANGMGRTFIGQADDATAAVTNPAGLMSLTRPQVYAEFKHTKLEAERLAAADSLTTKQPTTTTATVNSLSFASYSAPIGSRVAVGFSVHRFLDYEESFSFAPRKIPDDNSTFFPVNGAVDFVGSATYAGSVAVMVTSGLQVGVTVAANRLDADTFATRSNHIGVTPTNIPRDETSIDDSQTATSFTVGGLYRLKSDRLTFGFNYTKSPRFVTEMNLQFNPDADANPPTFDLVVQADGFPTPVEVNVPDHFGFGVAVRPTSRLLVAVDVVRVKYSSLSENTTVIFPGDVPLLSTDYDTPDVTEVHLGAELIVGNIMGKPFFLRGGVFTNPSHLTSYTGADKGEQAYYNRLPRKDDTRGTVGAGLVIGSRTQIDAAYVFGKEFVLSTAVRF